ncbi:MAG: hypothetical protein ACI841_004924 [Planctomycetota bacterium]|jgi:hypothetical protein
MRTVITFGTFDVFHVTFKYGDWQVPKPQWTHDGNDFSILEEGVAAPASRSAGE